MRNKAVAIVDDDEEVRLSMGSLLRACGFEARAFDSAAAFLAAAGLTAFGCLVTDVNMPGMTGLEMLDALRDRGAALPVIVISALDPEHTRRLAMAHGADAYLAKPVDPDELLACLRRLLGRSRKPRAAGNSG